MKYRRVPGTDIDLSEISMGTGDNAGLFVWGEYGALRAAVARALENGVNHFDTAPEYGRGRAETNLGSVLRDLGAKPCITTKVEVADEHLGDIAKRVVHTVEESLIRLGVDAVHFVQIHNPPGKLYGRISTRRATMEVEHYLGAKGAMEGIARLQKDGKILHTGMSCEYAEPAQVKEILQTGLMRWINVRYNLVNPTAGVDGLDALEVDYRYDGVMAEARRYQVGTGIVRPLAGGALTDTSLRSDAIVRHPLAGGALSSNEKLMNQMKAEVARARQLSFLCRESGDSMAVAAYRFILSHPDATSIITGISDGSHLDDALEAVRKGPLDASLLDRLRPIWMSNFAQGASA